MTVACEIDVHRPTMPLPFLSQNSRSLYVIYITISTFTPVRPYGVGVSVGVCPFLFHFTIPEIGSQNVTNKTSLVCVKSEKYALWVTLRLIRSMRRDKAEPSTLHN